MIDDIEALARELSRKQWSELLEGRATHYRPGIAERLVGHVRALAAELTPDEREWLLTPHVPPPAGAPCVPRLVTKGIVHVSLGNEPIIVPMGQAVVSILEERKP